MRCLVCLYYISLDINLTVKIELTLDFTKVLKVLILYPCFFKLFCFFVVFFVILVFVCFCLFCLFVFVVVVFLVYFLFAKTE